MEKKYSPLIEKNFLFILSMIFLALVFFIIKDILYLIIYSLILSYFLHPLYLFYLEKISNKKLSSIVTLFTATIGLFIPIALLTYFLILNLLKIIVEYKIYIENPVILNDAISGVIKKFTNSTIVSSINFSDLITKFAKFIVDLSTDFFSSITVSIIYFIVILFISYYILIYNKEMLEAIKEYIPMGMKKQDEILKNIKKNLKVLFKGYFLTGIIQTLVAIVGYILFSVPNILIISVLTLFSSLIPYIGTPIIWVPLSIYLILTGKQIAGIGLLIYGTFVISLIDNFIRPILMSDKETIPPPIVFVGFIGGLLVFGIIGIILGPIILSITSILLKYLKESHKINE